MKQGKSLQDLAVELDRQRHTKADYIIDTRHIVPHITEATNGDGLPITSLLVDQDDISINQPLSRLARRQVQERVGIPARYAERMLKDAPDLWERNVHGWFQQDPKRLMVRTLDEQVRAVLSDRYARIDNYDIMNTVFPAVAEMTREKGLRVESCEVTEKRLYIKVISERTEAEVKVGDKVQAGVVISNSEVGCGAFSVEPMIFRLVCLNGMILKDHGTRRAHLGARAEVSDELAKMLSEEAMRADDNALLLKTRDLVSGVLEQTFLQDMVDQIRETTERKIEGNPAKAVEVLATDKGLTEDDQGGIMRHLVAGGDLSQYGLLNAVTRYSQDVQDYDKATDLEKLGGDLVTLSAGQWRDIATAE